MERSNELRDRVLAGFEALSSGDTSLVERDTTRHEGVRLIGTDPDEWFGGERAAEVLKQEVQDTTEIEVSPRNLEAFVEGSVGWVSGRVVWILGDGREVPTRWTAVFHREGDDWKMVQAHTSVGVPNEELFGGWPSKVVGRSPFVRVPKKRPIVRYGYCNTLSKATKLIRSLPIQRKAVPVTRTRDKHLSSFRSSQTQAVKHVLQKDVRIS